MAAVSLGDFPAAFLARVIAAYCNDYRYQDQIPNPDFDPQQTEDPQANPATIANSETPAAFTKRMIVKEVKQRTLNYEIALDRKQGIDAKKEEIEGIQIG